MKPVFYVLTLSLCLLSCKKGKNLTHEVSVQFVTLSHSGISPEGDFQTYDPDNLNAIPLSPKYAHDHTPDEIAARFNSKLSSLLGKNNILLQNDTADYVLIINSMNLEESINSESYIDSCSSDYPLRYAYKSSLKYVVKATLCKNGFVIDSWSKEANSGESFRAKTDNCNKPKTFPIIRRTLSLVDQVAKELRVRISKKMYKLEK